jgi:hypothetical protein
MKDDEELSLYTARGIYTTEEAARIRGAALQIQTLIKDRASPFDDVWKDWQVPAGLVIGSLPDGWMDLPGGDIYLSTLNYERGLHGRRYDEWRRA